MALDQQRLTPEERANLVAYLDGELGEAEARSIATKLTQSATARRELESLEKTWQLLDHLPRIRATDDLTGRTLTRVEGLGQIEDVALGKMRAAGQVGLRVVVWAGLATLLFAVGFLATSRLWPDPTARLARELTLAEHLDEYRSVGSFEALEHLRESPLFASDRN